MAMKKAQLIDDVGRKLPPRLKCKEGSYDRHERERKLRLERGSNMRRQLRLELPL